MSKPAPTKGFQKARCKVTCWECYTHTHRYSYSLSLTHTRVKPAEEHPRREICSKTLAAAASSRWDGGNICPPFVCVLHRGL